MAVIPQHLASCPSVAPIDSSRIDASISTLERGISALERSISSLDVSSSLPEHIAILAAVLVLIGVVLEVVGLRFEYKDEKRLWRTGIVRAPEHPELRRYLFEAFATFIVILGVAGEAWTSLSLSSLNNQMRSATTQLRAKSDELVSLVTLEAANADAKTAQLDCESERLKKEALDATVELARITGPPYRITVTNDGLAIPDLSKSNQQSVVLTRDMTRILLPKSAKNTHLLWTLSIYQDDKGGHHFTFSPDIGGFDPHVNVFPNTGWLVPLQTDENGTVSTGWGGKPIGAPPTIK